MESIRLQVPEDFGIGNTGVLSEDQFVLLDAKLGRVMFFNGSGQLSITVGRQGVGPGEMLCPLKIAKNENHVVIADLLRQGIHLFRLGKKGMQAKHFFKVSAHPTDVCIWGEWIVAIGYWNDGQKGWWGRKMKLIGDKEEHQLFIANHVVFGEEERVTDTKDKVERRAALGASSLCTSNGNRFYTCWGGQMRILLLEGGNKDVRIFGHKGSFYQKPVPSVRLMKAYRQREQKTVERELLGLCQIKSITATSEAFYLMFTRAGKGVGSKETILQKYTTDGVFEDEMILSDSFPKAKVEEMQFSLQILKVNKLESLYLTQYQEYPDKRPERYIHRVFFK